MLKKKQKTLGNFPLLFYMSKCSKLTTFTFLIQFSFSIVFVYKKFRVEFFQTVNFRKKFNNQLSFSVFIVWCNVVFLWDYYAMFF